MIAIDWWPLSIWQGSSMCSNLPSPPPFLVALVAMAVFSVALAPTSAQATVVRHADIDRLVEISHLIVHGVIQDSSVEVDREARWLLTSVEVQEVFAGERSATNLDELRIRQWAGQNGSSRGRIAGDPKLVAGDEVVLFLRRDPDRQGWALAALSQAVFYIDGQGPRRRVRRHLEGLHLLQGDGAAPSATSHEEPDHHWSVFLGVLEDALHHHERGELR